MKSESGFNPVGKKFLAITAHPDDADFCAGGTMLKWLSKGAKGAIVIITNGDKGSHKKDLTCEQLMEIRKNEQLAASKVLGLEQTWFLEYPDAHLEVSQELKNKLVHIIREYKPDVVFTWDPTMAYSLRRNMVNHPDHRAAGQAALDACFPMSRDHLTFRDQEKEGLGPHCVCDIFLFNFENPNYFEEIGDFIDKKVELLKIHQSQVNTDTSEKTVRVWSKEIGSLADMNGAESFVHLSLDKD